MIARKKPLIYLLVLAGVFNLGGCKREVPVDNSADVARAERAERELADTLAALQQLRREKDLEVGIAANSSDQISQLRAQLDEAIAVQEQLQQAVKTAQAERDQAQGEAREAQELANELEKYLQESERRASILEKANKDLEALADELAQQVAALSEPPEEIEEEAVVE